MPRVADVERRVWDLMTTDFRWRPPEDFPVQVLGGSDVQANLQVFEVAMACVFAAMRPDYEWFVTRKSSDGGLDFLGHSPFLVDPELGIDAAVTIGGQCKKRARVDNIVTLVGGVLTQMAKTANPTFFVVALSADLDESRVRTAMVDLQADHRRHCHIVTRRQIEAMIGRHLDAIRDVLDAGLSPADATEVLTYFRERSEQTAVLAPRIELEPLPPVLAGRPFSVGARISTATTADSPLRFRWRPAEADGEVALMAPAGAGFDDGVALAVTDVADDPLTVEVELELVTHAVGDVALGRLEVTGQSVPPWVTEGAVELGAVRVVENARPRYFAAPFRVAHRRLVAAYDQAMAGGLATIAVVGPGGSGKSRVIEEVAQETRARGSTTIVAQQANSHDDPHRVLAALLTELSGGRRAGVDPAEHVLRTIAGYDSDLAERADPAVRAAFGRAVTAAPSEQDLISALLLLLVAQARRAPIVVHLKDLHWCPADVLVTIDRLLWQLEAVMRSPSLRRRPESGVLCVLEGRTRERSTEPSTGWSTASFEAFVAARDCPTVTCSAFTPADGRTFVSRLFEDRSSSRALVAEHLLAVQDELVDRVAASSGGNPFHALEHVQLLKDRGEVAQNPATGQLHLVRVPGADVDLPDSVFDAIRRRWQYLRDREPELAVLIWATALVEDQLPLPLFRHLLDRLAPTVSLRDVDRTEMVWTANGTADHVAFRHENHFQVIRRLPVPTATRDAVVDAYDAYFERARRPSASDRFRWARALLEHPTPDLARARRLLRSARTSARRAGDDRLARRITTTELDLTWRGDDRSPVGDAAFVARCDDEVALVREVMAVDRAQAAQRIGALQRRCAERLVPRARRSSIGLLELRRRALIADVVSAQILINDRRALLAGEVAGAVRREAAIVRSTVAANDPQWSDLEMEALFAEAIALDLSGEHRLALSRSTEAVALARATDAPSAPNIISTHANILLVDDLVAAETLQRRCLVDAEAVGSADRELIEVHLSEALVLLAASGSARSDALLAEAAARTTSASGTLYQLGHHPDAGAAALMRGIVSVLRDEGDEVQWFGQAVACATRGQEMETLWRSHIDLAVALDRRPSAAPVAADHARAAVAIIEETLDAHPDPGRSPRFGLVRLALVHAARILCGIDDPEGGALLRRHPEVGRSLVADDPTRVRPDRGGVAHHKWVRHGDGDYVVY